MVVPVMNMAGVCAVCRAVDACAVCRAVVVLAMNMNVLAHAGRWCEEVVVCVVWRSCCVQ